MEDIISNECEVSSMDMETQSNNSYDDHLGIKLDPAVLEAKVTTNKTPFSRQSSRSSTSSDPGSSSSGEAMFSRILQEQQQALQSISPQQLSLLLDYVATLRRQRRDLQRSLECAFCKTNGESPTWYSFHALKDWRGRVICPVLRAFRCPRCGATGDHAHTIKYCPENYDVESCFRTRSR